MARSLSWSANRTGNAASTRDYDDVGALIARLQMVYVERDADEIADACGPDAVLYDLRRP